LNAQLIKLVTVELTVEAFKSPDNDMDVALNSLIDRIAAG
jgi:hypothetical protein